MRAVRVYASPTVDNRDAPRFCFDALIDDQFLVLGDNPIFGMQGEFSPNATGKCYPFVLYPNDGRLDFGSGFDNPPNERQASLGRL